MIGEYGKVFGDTVEESRGRIDKVADGDMQRCEGMLLTQAHALQSIFTNLSGQALNREYLKNFETFLRLALKAQS